MLLPFYSLPLLLLAFPPTNPIPQPKIIPALDNSKSLCTDRCHRLLRRSLDSIDRTLDVEQILYRIGAFRKTQLLSGKGAGSSEELALPAGEFKEICWKFFDFEDCQKQCQKVYHGKRRRKKRRGGENNQMRAKPKEHAVTEPEHRVVLHFCRRADFGVPLDQFACVHKFHSFLEVHCSSYQQRAVQLRLIALQLEQPGVDVDSFGGKKEFDKLKMALDQELCLLLHQHSSCLVNAGARFCPQFRAPQPILSRHSLRDHFLSLLLPFGRALDQKAVSKFGHTSEPPLELDLLFPDLLLDHCQLFDFHRMANEWMERMAAQQAEAGVAEGQSDMANLDGGGEQRSTTKRAVLPKTAANGEEDGEQGVEVTIAPSNRRVFSSEEDLEDTPPNFFYSTARLPKDFYTRYAIWWGNRGVAKSAERRKSAESNSHEEELTAVQLLPSASPPRAHSQVTLNSQLPIAHSQPSTQRTTTTTTTTPASFSWETQEVVALSETRPDSTLSTPVQRPNEGNDVGWTVTLPYLVNGQVTQPVTRWPGEVKTTEIRLMDGTTRRIWTATEQEEEEWRRREAVERTQPGNAETTTTLPNYVQNEVEDRMRKFGEAKKPIDEYEEEWAYEDEFASSQFEEDDRYSSYEDDERPRLLKPVISSSVEEMINGMAPGNGEARGKTQTKRPKPSKADSGRTLADAPDSSWSTEENGELLPLRTTSEPMFRETNIYFAKILEFGEEPEADAEWMQGRQDTTSPKTVAHMVHYPGDQLPIHEQHAPQAELEIDGPGTNQRHRDQHRNSGSTPYEILPADPDEFMVGPKTSTPVLDHVHWKTGAPPINANTRQRRPTERPKILVSAEPVPAKKSETLLVLLGVYLTFFALAAFFLFCLVLACLERNRRQASRRQSAKASTGSAILYMDPKNGKLKHVV